MRRGFGLINEDSSDRNLYNGGGSLVDITIIVIIGNIYIIGLRNNGGIAVYRMVWISN